MAALIDLAILGIVLIAAVYIVKLVVAAFSLPPNVAQIVLVIVGLICLVIFLRALAQILSHAGHLTFGF